MTVTERKLDQLRARLPGLRAGSVEVVKAKVEPQFDHSGEEYVEVTLVLSDPPNGAETWPLEDAFELRQQIRRVASEELEITESVSIAFAASVDVNLEDDEDEDEDHYGDLDEPGEGS